MGYISTAEKVSNFLSLLEVLARIAETIPLFQRCEVSPCVKYHCDQLQLKMLSFSSAKSLCDQKSFKSIIAQEERISKAKCTQMRV